MLRPHRRGLSFFDFIAIAAVGPILLTLAMGSMSRAREQANRIKCMNNIKQIGCAMMLYANENKGIYPRVNWKIDAGTTQYTGVNAPNPFGPGGPSANDVTAAMFLLVRTQDITGEVFICPSNESATPGNFGGAGTAQGVSNFAAEQHLSYSLANPYPNTNAVNLGYKWNNSLTAEFAVASDMNPGSPALTTITVNAPLQQMRLANSNNHQQQGQNVVYGDGHAEWQQSPFCGARLDNIFTVSTGSSVMPTPIIVGSPSGPEDSVMLPISTMPPVGATSSRVMLFAIIAGIIVLAALGVVLFLVLRKKPGQPIPGMAGPIMPGASMPAPQYAPPGATQASSGPRPPPLPPRR